MWRKEYKNIKVIQLTRYLALPAEITPFERRFLAHLNKIALIFFYLHIPVLMGVAWAAGTGPMLALVLSLAVLIGPTIAYRIIQNPRSTSVVYGITAMLMGGLLVHFGQGPVQIEMHFYFFALLAMLCMFANPMVNLAAAVTVALHHLIVWLLLPSSVFNYNAQWWVVLVHAGFVVLETVAACYISREFFDNVIGLEKIVEARTATIREQQRDMRLILNNLQEGLITIDLDGRVTAETSRAIQEWFGTPATGEKLAAWMSTKDATFGEWLELSLESVKEGMLPAEVALGQLPTRLKTGDRTYAVRYQTMDNSEDASTPTSIEQRAVPRSDSNNSKAPEKILVIIDDITEALNRGGLERYQSDLMQAFQHMMRDKTGFLEFLREADDIIRALRAGDYDSLDHLKRLVHTLKGNAAIFGMRCVSETCHSIESAMAESDEAPTEAEVADLEQAWRKIRTDIATLMGEARERNIEIDDSEYDTILNALRASVDVRTLARMVESWRLEPTGKRLQLIEQQIKGIAERMGKSNVTVLIEPNDLRFNSEHFAPFWSAFIHVLRNTVDHGVEASEERQKRGKPEQSHIKISTAIEGNRFVVTVEDDGPGVDWERLREKAAELGIAGSASLESAQLMCIPGLSSKDEVTELSGRGVGMAALADACEPLGGTIEVESELGVGTRITFVFPKNREIYEGHAALLKCARPLLAA
jgi:HPt (histidine-containing phosphotransfer) domain-containing protein/two-component sensor histidine kinase